MGANFKRELMFGLISLFIFTGLLMFYTVLYSSQPLLTTSTTISSKIATGSVLSNNEISKHGSASDCWIIIEGGVYDVTNFLSRHPGGGGLISPYCGLDATQAFLTKDGRGSHSQQALQLLGLIYLGDLNGTVTRQPDTNAIQTVPIRNEEGEDD